MAEVKRMRSPTLSAPRSRSLTRCTATGPIPVSTTRSGAWPCRTTRSRPSGSCTPFIRARNASASASMAWASNRRAPLRRTAVSGSSIASGCRRGTTVLFLMMAYRSFGRFRQASTRLDTPPFSHRHHPVSVIAHHDGTLDMRELRRRVTKAEFRAADKDTDGTLDKVEYESIVAARFGAANRDNDTTIEAKELQTSAGR